MEVLYTARFLRSYKKLSPELQEEVELASEDFKDKENHEHLKLHKLHGSMREYYAFSVNFRYRIIVKFEGTKAFFMDVGDHTVYDV